MAVAIAWLPRPAGTRRRVAKPSVEEPDAAEPARLDLWGARSERPWSTRPLIDAKVELPPATSAAATVFRGGPLTFPNDGTNPCCRARDEGPRRAGPAADGASNADCPGERRIVVGRRGRGASSEQRAQKPFGLAQREMVEEPQGQGGLDGKIRVPPLPAPLATPAGCPGAIASEDTHTVTSPRRTRA